MLNIRKDVAWKILIYIWKVQGQNSTHFCSEQQNGFGFGWAYSKIRKKMVDKLLTVEDVKGVISYRILLNIYMRKTPKAVQNAKSVQNSNLAVEIQI